MDTDRLIQALAADAAPVTPLRSPWRRMWLWALAGAVYLVVMVAILSPRSDLDARMRDPWFMVEQAAALAAGLLAAVAALTTSVPGRSRTIVRVAIAVVAAWVSLVVLNAVREVRLAAGGEAVFYTDWGCVASVLAGAAVPAVVMVAMLRRGAVLTPHVTAALGGFAAAGLGNLAGCLSHPDASNLIVLVWHVGTVIAVAGLAGMLGARLLPWRSRQAPAG